MDIEKELLKLGIKVTKTKKDKKETRLYNFYAGKGKSGKRRWIGERLGKKRDKRLSSPRVKKAGRNYAGLLHRLPCDRKFLRVMSYPFFSFRKGKESKSGRIGSKRRWLFRSYKNNLLVESRGIYQKREVRSWK